MKIGMYKDLSTLDMIIPKNGKKTKPILGMRFSTTVELKFFLSKYAVANSYELWFEKNDKDKLLVRCCKRKFQHALLGCLHLG